MNDLLPTLALRKAICRQCGHRVSTGCRLMEDDAYRIHLRQSPWPHGACQLFSPGNRVNPDPEDCPPEGPGSRLEGLLGWFIRKTDDCDCEDMRCRMNEWGPDGCRKHLDEILDHLANEADKRRLPYTRGALRLLVRTAIKLHERKSRSTVKA